MKQVTGWEMDYLFIVFWMLLKQCYNCQRPGRRHHCKVRLNSFLSILSFELIFFNPGIPSSQYAPGKILDALWVWWKTRIKNCCELDWWTGHCWFCTWNEPERSNRRRGRGLLTSLMLLFSCDFPRLYWQWNRRVESILVFKQKWGMQWNSANSKVVKGPIVQGW